MLLGLFFYAFFTEIRNLIHFGCIAVRRDDPSTIALDQTEQAENEKKLRTIYGEKHSRFQELEALIQEKNDTREILTNFINKLEDLTGKQTEFREELWGGLVDHIRIDEKSSTVVFRGGIEIAI